MREAEITTTLREVRVTNYELRIKNSELVTGSTIPLLKRDLGCELYAAWTTASQKRITDAYVTRCGERV